MDPFVPYVMAELRSIELRQQADHSRLLASRPAVRRSRPWRGVRRALGLRLIRVGTRMTVPSR